jgi:hypothetical protein
MLLKIGTFLELDLGHGSTLYLKAGRLEVHYSRSTGLTVSR